MAQNVAEDPFDSGVLAPCSAKDCRVLVNPDDVGDSALQVRSEEAVTGADVESRAGTTWDCIQNQPVVVDVVVPSHRQGA